MNKVIITRCFFLSLIAVSLLAQPCLREGSTITSALSRTRSNPTVKQPWKSRVRSKLVVKNYRVLFDGRKDGYQASGGATLFFNNRLMIWFQRASDAEAGIYPLLTESRDQGVTWTKP